MPSCSTVQESVTIFGNPGPCAGDQSAQAMAMSAEIAAPAKMQRANGQSRHATESIGGNRSLCASPAFDCAQVNGQERVPGARQGPGGALSTPETRPHEPPPH